MPFFEKNIKDFVKKRLEKKSCVLTAQVKIHFAKLFSTSRNAVFSRRHQRFCQKNAWKNKVVFSPHKLKSTLRNCLALCEMPFFYKNIKIVIKKWLEKKSCVFDPTSLNPLREIVKHFAKCCFCTKT
jgi:hypothetical protein